MSKAVLIVVFAAALVFSANAQNPVNFPGFPTSPAATKKEPTALDKLKQKLNASRRKNAAEYVGDLAELLNKYPYSWQVESSISLDGSAIKNSTPEETKNLVSQLIAKTENIPQGLRALIYSKSSGALLDKGFVPESLEFSQKAAELLTEPNWLDFYRKVREQLAAERLKENPKYKPSPFNEESAKKDFNGKKAEVYSVLGKSLWEAGNYEAAEKAYRESYAALETKEATFGIAKAAEKNGNDADALKYATIAALTGTLQPKEMEYFYAVYAKQNQGKTDGAEKYLDAEYLKTYRNPIKGEKYQKTAQRTNRIVLAEFFTGAGCKPCVGVDSAFDVIRKDYSNKELSLLVYHANIPINDPLSNYGVNAREKYYGINYAPKVYIDGAEFKDDMMSVETEDQRKQRLYNTLAKDINSNLENQASAEIKLKASRKGQTIKASVSADKLKTSSDDLTLHIALVENETSYSGENGFRFHIMVVRALAGDQDKRTFGYPVNATKAAKFAYVFDVDDIVKRNFAYYDTSVVERREEYKIKFAGMENPPFVPDYKYRRNEIDAKHLSVVAFLQDNKTKQILQSAVIDLAK